MYLPRAVGTIFATESDSTRRPSGRTTGLLAAVDFGGTKTAVAIADEFGRILGRRRFDTAGGRDALAAVATAIAVVRELAGSTRIAAIGVVSPGIIGETGIRLAPHVGGWERLSLPALFGAAFPNVALTFGNDVKAAALAESRTGNLRGVDPGVLVNLGTGVAMATVVQGRILQGAHGWAGEVGYSPAITADGRRVGLEELAGGAALDQLAAVEGLPGAAALIDAGLADPALGRRILKSFDVFADGLISWCLVLDPQRIVVTGGLLAASSLWWGPLERRLSAVLPDPPQLYRSAFHADAALHGAIQLAADTAGGLS